MLKIQNRSTDITDREGMLELLGSRPSASGLHINEKTALSHPAFFRGISLIADRVSGLDLSPYKRIGEGKEKDKTHPAYRLLRQQANPYQSAYSLKNTVQKDKSVHGNGYIFVERDPVAKPLNLYRLDPTQTFPVIEAGILYYSTVLDGEYVKLDPSDVIHIKGIGDGLVGWSVIELLRDAIGLNVAANRNAAYFFRNGANPTYVIKFPPNFNEARKKEFREGWAEAHSGVSNRHKMALIPQGFEISTYGFNLEEIQMSELRQFSLVDFANIVGVPSSYLNSTQNVSYSSLESEAKSFLANSLNPHLQSWESELDRVLLTEDQKESDSHYFSFDRKQLEQTDISALSAALNIQKQSGAITTNEYRKALNLPPSEDPAADKLVLPLNFGFSEIMWEQAQKSLETPEPVPMPPEPISKDPIPVDPEADPQPPEPTDDRLANLTRSTVDRLATRLRSAIRNKGSHNLIESHLDVFVESLKPVNEGANEICERYLRGIQEELDHALPEQIKIETEQLLQEIL